MSHFLTEGEIEELLTDATAADRVMAERSILKAALAPRLRRLLEEQRTLRDQAGERERFAAEEVKW